MEFKILKSCLICGEHFDSDYKMSKHMSKFHYGFDSVMNPLLKQKCQCGNDTTEIK